MRKSYSRGAMLTPEPHTVTAALRVMGLAREERFTNYHRVLNRATWSARQAGRILLGLLIALLVSPGTTIVLGTDGTVEQRSGGKIKAKGCYRDAVRSSKSHVIRCFGLKRVSMMLLSQCPGRGGCGRYRFSRSCVSQPRTPHGDDTRPVWTGYGR
jgi:DDE superfamily endonuclease